MTHAVEGQEMAVSHHGVCLVLVSMTLHERYRLARRRVGTNAQALFDRGIRRRLQVVARTDKPEPHAEITWHPRDHLVYLVTTLKCCARA